MGLRIASALVLVLLAACTTPQEAVTSMGRKYYGRNVDEFFVEHGPPASVHTLNSGEKLYEWVGGVATTTVPGTSTTTVKPTAYGTYKAETTNTGGYQKNYSCTVQLRTTAAGIINDIVIRDSGGVFDLSRCAEVFDG